MCKNILLITSSGGGGLLQSAIAIEDIEKEKNPAVKIIKKDLLLEWSGKALGYFARAAYNWTHKTGRVFFTNFFVNLNRAFDFIVTPSVFLAVFFNLKKHNIDKVIDNQVLGIKPVIKAIRLYNFLYKKNIKLEKVFVDLPTKDYKNILLPIKKLSKKDKSNLTLYTVKPFLETNQSEEDFWEKYCKISTDKVFYKGDIIRKNFRKFIGRDKNIDNLIIPVKTKSLQEKNVMKKVFQRGNILFEEKENGFDFTINKEDKVFLILLGSQPSPAAISGYVHGFLNYMSSNGKNYKYNLFIFADKFTENAENNFTRIITLLEKQAKYQENVSIIPMSFQGDETIAPLFFRSDLTITRSGGHSIMELMAISKGINWIHSEAKQKKDGLSLEELFNKIPCWERGNAKYLYYIAKKDSSGIVSTDILKEKLEEITF